jgi:hypothetical protein
MTYDAWKTRSPDDDYYDPYEDDDTRDDCDHTDGYEIDVCTGKCTCDVCSHTWYATSDQVNAELDRQATYWEDVERDERRRWWRDQFDRLAFWRRWRKPKPLVLDDEIPF